MNDAKKAEQAAVDSILAKQEGIDLDTILQGDDEENVDAEENKNEEKKPALVKKADKKDNKKSNKKDNKKSDKEADKKDSKESNEKENEPVKKMNKKLDYIGRGFDSLEAAYDFVNTEVFARLGQADKDEFTQWLKK